VAAAACLTLVYLGGPLRAISQQLPVFDINPIGRLRSLLGFFMAGLAAIGFDMVYRLRARGSSTNRVPSWVFTGLVVVAAAACALVISVRAGRLASGAGHTRDFLESSAVAAAFGLVAVGAIVAAFVLRGRWRMVALVTLPVVALVQALAWVWPFWPRVDESTFYPQTDAHDFLDARIGSDRFAGAGFALFPPTGGFYGLRSVVGHSFVDQRWEEGLEAIDPDIFLSRTFTALPTDPALATSPMLDRMAARFFVAHADGFPLIAAPPLRTSEPSGSMALRPGSTIEMAAPTGGWRGIGIGLTRPADGVGPEARVTMEVVDDAGVSLARGERLVPDGSFERDLVVPLPELDAGETGAARTLRITLERSDSSVEVAAAADGLPVLSVQPALDDGLRLEFSDGVAIYERQNAVSRVHWATATRVIADEDERLEYLVDQPLIAGEVVLSRSGPSAEGLPAQIDVVEDGGDRLVFDVDAEGSGYLVVIDALPAGWGVEVDGTEADLVDADHVGSAVFVEAGRHRVEISYQPPGWRLGVLTTVVALAIAVVLYLWGDAGLRRLRRSHGEDANDRG
jgi:hypothetical protein